VILVFYDFVAPVSLVLHLPVHKTTSCVILVTEHCAGFFLLAI